MILTPRGRSSLKAEMTMAIVTKARSDASMSLHFRVCFFQDEVAVTDAAEDLVPADEVDDLPVPDILDLLHCPITMVSSHNISKGITCRCSTTFQSNKESKLSVSAYTQSQVKGRRRVSLAYLAAFTHVLKKCRKVLHGLASIRNWPVVKKDMLPSRRSCRIR